MRPARVILASAMAVIVLASTAFAQQAANGAASGMVTQIDRLNGTMAIQETQSGTVGASGGATQEFKVQDAQLLENFHAGDRVTFSATENNGVKTITKMQRQ
jgi:Cu/Ag efflux protein CusF